LSATPVLEIDDVHVFAVGGAHQRDRVHRCAAQQRRVDADDAGDALGVKLRHAPSNEAAPVVADDDRLLDLERIEQTDEVAGEIVDVVLLDRFGARGLAVAALIGGDGVKAGGGERRHLITP